MMIQGDIVQLGMDSKTAVAFCNKMGGTRSIILNKIALNLWDYVLSMGGWLKAIWVPRDCNQIADMLSKESILVWEFRLSPVMARTLWDKWFLPEVDCFASNQFHLLPKYYSFHPDPAATKRDAFSVLQWPSKIYAFPPVPLIAMTLDKIETDGILAIVVVPHWTTAKWWDKLRELLKEPPMHLGHYQSLLQPLPGRKLPYLGVLVACLLKGKGSHC